MASGVTQIGVRNAAQATADVSIVLIDDIRRTIELLEHLLTK
jgi:hypothetical protein